jgi:ribonuclease HI
VFDGQKITEGNGHMEKASNNDAELEAAIQGLAMVLKMRLDGKIPIGTHEIYLVSDSQIVLGWVDGTYRFKQKDKRFKYDQLQHVCKKLNVKTRWVQGHSGDEHNERCDVLANLGRHQMGPTDSLPSKNAKKKAAIKEAKASNTIGIKKKGTISLWYKGVLKIVDLELNLVENHDETKHGKRDSHLEIK